jgi:hypothetical protein
MTVVRWICLLWLTPAIAGAQPLDAPSRDEPPAPLVMPELKARTRVAVSQLISRPLLFEVRGSATYAVAAAEGLELFGDLGVRVSIVGDYWPGGPMNPPFHDGSGLGNLRLGARFHGELGPVRITPSVWGWAPSSTSGARDHDDLEAVTGVTNNRAYGPHASAIGVALDAAFVTDSTFVQAEVGAAIVADGGPQIDDVFAALGCGTMANHPRSGVLAEVRVEAIPSGRQSTRYLVGPALGYSRRDGEATMWRVRFHPYFVDSEAGLAVGVDIIHRFQ